MILDGFRQNLDFLETGRNSLCLKVVQNIAPSERLQKQFFGRFAVDSMDPDVGLQLLRNIHTQLSTGKRKNVQGLFQETR